MEFLVARILYRLSLHANGAHAALFPSLFQRYPLPSIALVDLLFQIDMRKGISQVLLIGFVHIRKHLTGH
jgi:hypothetical protein